MNPLFRLDVLSERSRFREHPVGEKLLFSLGILVLALIMKPIPFALLASLSLTIFLLRSGLAVSDLASLLLIPSAFLASAVIPLLLEMDPGISNEPLRFSLSTLHSPLFRFSPSAPHFRVSQEGMRTAGETVLRSMTALLSVYALTATTPMPRILTAMRSMRMPEILIDLLYFSHRMLHLFMESAHIMARAQRARGGERTFLLRFHSSVLLLHRLMDRIRERVIRMERALFSRGYTGELRFLPAPSAKSTARGITRILIFQAALIIISLTLPGLAGTF